MDNSQKAATCPHRPQPRRRRGVTFRLSSGYFFNYQGSDETAQVRHLSIVKWVLSQLTKTSLLPQRVSPTRLSQDDAVGSFSTIKWGHFRLSKFTLMAQSGFIFDCQMGSFSLDKNSCHCCQARTNVFPQFIHQHLRMNIYVLGPLDVMTLQRRAIAKVFFIP